MAGSDARATDLDEAQYKPLPGAPPDRRARTGEVVAISDLATDARTGNYRADASPTVSDPSCPSRW